MYKRILLSVIIVIFIGNSNTLIAQNLTGEEKEWLAKAARIDKNGWIYLHIEGEPFKRGFQRGYLTANEIDEFFQTIAFLEKFETAREIDFFVKSVDNLFKDKVSEEFVQEMEGMVAGMEKAGKKITYQDMLFMNGFIDVLWHWYPQEKGKAKEPEPGCSAFIATGDATADGKIVMAHNSWYFYSILGGFSGFDPAGTPVFERARKAMQYANSIDEWAQIMVKNNNGAYANSWLLGDIRTNEIARLELGLKHNNLEKKNNGYFTGSNIVDDVKILREETNATYDDVRDFCVARRVRWKQLFKKNYGNINVEIAKQMLADHYDVYLEKEQPSFRTICGHWELDNGMVPGTMGAYLPGGAVDGKVVDSNLAKQWKLWAKWGSSCDIGFDAKKFLEQHPQYDWLNGYLKDLPAEPWTVFPLQK